MAETAVQKTAKRLQLGRALNVNRLNNRSRLNARNNLGNDNSCSIGIARHKTGAFIFMNPPRDLWQELCSYDNLFLAYKKARKHKTTRDYVVEFEKDLKNNLLLLRSELLLHCYKPKPLVNFTIRDPKTRKISKSDFRDRVIHHALCNIIEPIFEKTFIYDSYANRIGKGTLKAIERFDSFKRKATRNNTLKCYVLKADVKKYFESVNHNISVSIIKKKIKDNKILWLINRILENSARGGGQSGAGMPLGNLTSQFFANVYLNELDYFVKYKLKVEYYIRYVDDFVILHNSKEQLEAYKAEIDNFLRRTLDVQLHPDKSKIFPLSRGTTFLGLRIFYYHKLLKKSNIWKFRRKLAELYSYFNAGRADYDIVYDFMEGWIAYSIYANAHKFRKKLLNSFEEKFEGEISAKEFNRYLKSQKNIFFSSNTHHLKPLPVP